MDISWGYGSDQRLRKENQDTLGVFQHQHLTFAVVCDGMGGHVGGAQASCIAVREAHDAILDAQELSAPDALKEAVERANRRIHDTARKSHRLMGMGTTIAAMAIQDGMLWIAHVGDSRAYLIRNGEVRQLTRDHTMVNLFVEAELLSPEDAATHPEAHVLSRSLGVERTVEVELSEPFSLRNDDVIFLCSDGVHGVITDWELGNVDWTLPQRAVDAVLDLIEEREGDDNATAVVISMSASGEGIAPSPIPDPDAKLQELLVGEDARRMPHQGAIHPPAMPGEFPDDPFGSESPTNPSLDASFISYTSEPVIYYDEYEGESPEPAPVRESQGPMAEAAPPPPLDLVNPVDTSPSLEAIAPDLEPPTNPPVVVSAPPPTPKPTAVEAPNPPAVPEFRKQKRDQAKGRLVKIALIGCALLVGVTLALGLVVTMVQSDAGAPDAEAVAASSETEDEPDPTTAEPDAPDAEAPAPEPEPEGGDAEFILSTPDGSEMLNGDEDAQLDVNSDAFYAPNPPRSERRLPHRPRRFSSPPPGGSKQFLAVNAARNNDCAGSIQVVQDAMRDTIDHAQLFTQGWYCVKANHQDKLAAAVIQSADTFATTIEHFEGRRDAFEVAREQEAGEAEEAEETKKSAKGTDSSEEDEVPDWFYPATGGIEFRLLTFLDHENSSGFATVMRDLLGDPTITDHLGTDVYLEAAAARSLARIESPTEEQVNWRARRVYIASKALSSPLRSLMAAHRPDLLTLAEEALEEGARRPQLFEGTTGIPEPVQKAYDIGTGVEPEPVLEEEEEDAAVEQGSDGPSGYMAATNPVVPRRPTAATTEESESPEQLKVHVNKNPDRPIDLGKRPGSQ